MIALRRGGVLGVRSLLQSSLTPSLTDMKCRRMSTYVSVIGLHWKTDETQLREVFSRYGVLEDAKILTPEHSTMHLWASLIYSTFDEALEAAIEMNGQELDGRLLRVSIVDPPTESDATRNETLDEE